MKKLVALAGLLVLGSLIGVAFAGRGSDSASRASEPVEAQTNPNPVLNPAGSSPARLAGDGRYFGYVRSASKHPPTIRFDVAQFFFGTSVQKAAEQDGAVAPGEPVSNDHYERNPDTRANALTVANDASVTGASPVSRLIPYGQVQARCRSGCADGTVPASLAEFFAAFERKRDGMTAVGDPVWVTIRVGVVVRIDEQYFP